MTANIKLEDVQPFLNTSRSAVDGSLLLCGNGRTSKTTSDARFELVEELIAKPRHCWLKAWDYLDRSDVFGPFDDIEDYTYSDYARTIPTRELLAERFPLPKDLWNYVSVGNITNLNYDEQDKSRDISFFGMVLFPLAVTRYENGNKKKKAKHYKIREDLAEIFGVEPVTRLSYNPKTIAKIVLDKVAPVIGGKNALLIVRSFQQNDGLRKEQAEKLADDILEVYSKSSMEKTIELFVDSSHLKTDQPTK